MTLASVALKSNQKTNLIHTSSENREFCGLLLLLLHMLWFSSPFATDDDLLTIDTVMQSKTKIQHGLSIIHLFSRISANFITASGTLRISLST